ncbi:MAG: prepilin-type N-terminal cleavage/methylation domain-containing protein [Oscillospiraceae bacterium]|nr:prepilin-type N-terminal cleavage/methylation domain-containing protein [Oscillospiraceae bacterium]
MKKSFKGFTLVECLIAMAILAVAGTLMAEIYATVASRNNANHFLNTSLANQMQYIENYTNSATLVIYYGDSDTTEPHADPNLSSNVPPHMASVSDNHNYVTVTKRNSDGTWDTTAQYSFPVDIYVMYSRDTKNEARTSVTVDADGKRSEADNTSYGDISENIDDLFETKDAAGNITGVSLRYKYILGHTTS